MVYTASVGLNLPMVSIFLASQASNADHLLPDVHTPFATALSIEIECKPHT